MAPLFVVVRAHGPDWRAGRPLEEQPEWDAHAAFMDALEDEGFIALGGPLGDDDALLVVRAASEDEVAARLTSDPWTVSGLLRTTLVAPWTIRLGALEMPSSEGELLAVARAWDEAMIGNDAEAIGSYMADDWTIIGSDGNVTSKAAFLDLIRSGNLMHDVMESHDLRVRIYREAAVVVARGVSGGAYLGTPFRFTEMVTCVFVRRDGRWRCVLTHLSPIGE